MIRPKHFGYNEETAQNNSFQSKDNSLTENQISKLALEEFDAFTQKLKDSGINVHIMEDTDSPVKPDAVFPNNWISFHDDGLLMTYPMYSKLRRNERREDIIEYFKSNFKVEKNYTFENYEDEDMFLEGTGSLILDRVNKIAYANLSPRTDLRLLDKWCILSGHKKVHFLAKDKNGNDIYHTNVMMALGETFVILCLECIPDSPEKENLIQILQDTDKDIIDITLDQVNQFAGNMLQIRNDRGERFLVLSQTAFNSLTEEQIIKIQKHTNFLIADIPVIEKYGGGSVRCMLAEVFLKKK